MDASSITTGESGRLFTGTAIDVTGMGKIELGELLHSTSQASIYRTSNPGIIAKLFDLYCDKPDEVSYVPYLNYELESANFDDILKIGGLREHIPAYFGSNIDYERKFAYIAMEFLQGQDLQTWCHETRQTADPAVWNQSLRQALFETFDILTHFHSHRILLLDFKPDNVIRLDTGEIKFVDLGAFVTPRHAQDSEKLAYATTPDYAELLIDTSNVEAGETLTETSDIFAAGVAMFELATGASRLTIAPETADQILEHPEAFRFRDSQIRDVWKQHPHLRPLFPLVEAQLGDRQILFSEFWPLLKGYLSTEVADWEDLETGQKDRMIVDTGTTFIREHLPDELQWLSEPIAQATNVRRVRLKTVQELMSLVADPLNEVQIESLLANNGFLQYMQDLDQSLSFLPKLNQWNVRSYPQSDREAVSAALLARRFADLGNLCFLKLDETDPSGHRFYQVVADTDADNLEEHHMTLWDLREDRTAWLD